MAEATLPATHEPDWLSERRRRGAQLSATLELPTTRTAGWEFTDLAGLELDAFVPADGGDASCIERAARLFEAVPGALALEQVDALALDGTAGVGADAPAGAADADTNATGADMNAAEATPTAPLVMPLSLAVERHPDLVRAHLGSIVTAEDPFVARNEAAWVGGAFVYVPRGVRLEVPILITAIQDADGAAVNWRTLIVLEEGAEAEIWEQYVDTAGSDGAAAANRAAAEDNGAAPRGSGPASLFNTVVELSIGPNAHLRYVNGQGLSERSWVFGSQRAEVGPDGSLDWAALGFGSARGKVRMETKLAGAGSQARVTGAYVGHGRQHLDFDTTQEHAAPRTTSDLAFRGLLFDRSTAVWRGMIRVDPGAQQTDAFQESRNLLLSKRAHADAIPGLEIEANDVRCTHAAAVAQIDREQVHYLMAHGLPRPQATRLIIDGFLQTLVERFAAGPVREAVGGALERRVAAILD